MKALTQRQSQILDFIRSFIDEHTYPPTIRQIGSHFSITPKGAHDHIKALARKGHLRFGANASRTIEILQENTSRQEPDFIDVPILGHVAAGKPIFSEASDNGKLSLPASMLHRGRHFVLEVRGDSMINAGIIDGDLAIFQYQEQANNGEIIVARVDEAYTLKRYYKEANRIKLMAENEDYPPIYTQNIQVVGKLKTLIRNY